MAGYGSVCTHTDVDTETKAKSLKCSTGAYIQVLLLCSIQSFCPVLTFMGGDEI